MMKISTTVVIAAVALLISIIVAVSILVARGDNVDTVLNLVATAIIPTFMTLFVVGKVDSVQQQQQVISAKTDTISDNVNGNLTKLVDKVDQVASKPVVVQATIVPPPPTESSTP